ncbi:homeobox protein DBX1-B-like [Bolinopsis microptera]|uniref:homeobox protein DBX1-B-like n=1 Tax=Bolinopsis microptera TaxID=2820187 RepID=UPI0030799161
MNTSSYNPISYTYPIITLPWEQETTDPAYPANYTPTYQSVCYADVRVPTSSGSSAEGYYGYPYQNTQKPGVKHFSPETGETPSYKLDDEDYCVPVSISSETEYPTTMPLPSSYYCPPSSGTVGNPYYISSQTTRYMHVSADSSTPEPAPNQTTTTFSPGYPPISEPSVPNQTTTTFSPGYLPISEPSVPNQTTTTFSPGYPPISEHIQSRTEATPRNYQYPISTSTVCSSVSALPLPVTSLPLPNQQPVGIDFPYHLFEYPAQNPGGGKIKKEKKRTEFSSQDLKLLEAAFAESDFARGAKREKLASSLGVSLRSITVWFQNKRAKMRKEKKSMEMLELAAKTGIVDLKQ